MSNEPLTTWLDGACAHCPECNWSDFPSQLVNGRCPDCGAITILPENDSESCRVCGCTDEDCSWCITLTGDPCAWEQPGLCTACASYGSNDVERARLRGRHALRKAKKRRAPGTEALRQHGRQCIRVSVQLRAYQQAQSPAP
jgi:hypothetical protein